MVAIAMIEILMTAVRNNSPLNDGKVMLGIANNGAAPIAAVLAEPGSTIIEKTYPKMPPSKMGSIPMNPLPCK